MKSKKHFVSGAFFLLTFAASLASADTTGTSELTVSPTGGSNSVPEAESIDELITNNNLRALSGSTSKWSIASQFNYNGGSLSSPLSQDRPNIADASGTTTKSDLDGSISLKYNLNAKSSLQVGLGVRWIAPLTPGGPSNYTGTTYDAMNPYITYQYIYKWWGIQSVMQASIMQWTQADQTALGYGQQLNIDQENMYDLGKSNVSVGASTVLQYQWFNKSGSYGSPSSDEYVANLGTLQSQYLFTISPEIEYQMTEKVNLRALLSLWTYEHYVASSNKLSLVHDAVFSSVGVGVSVTRDIFLYPNIQFLPGQLTAAETNLGLQATVNVF